MVKQEVDIKILLANNNMIIAPDKGETDTKLQEELLDVGKQGALEISFFRLLVGCNEVKNIRVLQGVMREA